MIFQACSIHFRDSEFCPWLFLVPLKGGIGGIVHPPIGRKNATYIPLIVLAFVWGLYATDPTLYRNLKNPWNLWRIIASPKATSSYSLGPAQGGIDHRFCRPMEKDKPVVIFC